ncbi:MAG: SDR family oxidoreductase [Clostridiales Family XIII bacterium]|jgi:NAD(P)-dependent dehydrogenase (short-subunit alcohol dehydrogenase family)|nr:SDR family oxidoreductase [Clostridiales Family XIII bacterium]
MGRLEGKIAIVTGAGNGIGQATAIRFAKEGAKVVATTRNPEHGQATLKAIKDAGGEGIFVQADIRNKDEIKAVYAKALEAYGELDITVNCAGVLVHKPFLEHTDEDFNLILETNYRAYVWSMQEAIPIFLKQGRGGSIVNIASISVMVPELFSYFYGGCKAALNKLSIDVAKEFAPKQIRINVVCPGPVNTGMTPAEVKNSPEQQKFMTENVAIIGRLGEPDDIANLCLFLASDEASWITGSTYVADGGTSLAV